MVTHLLAVARGAITPSGVVGALSNGAALTYLLTPHVRRALSGVPELDVPDGVPTS